MKVLKLSFLAFSALLLGCSPDNRSEAEAIAEDVPVFVNTLKTLDKSSAENAFDQLKGELKYGIVDLAPGDDSFEAASRLQPPPGQQFDGLISLTVPKSTTGNPADFGVGLLLHDTTSGLFAKKVIEILGREKYIDEHGNKVWEVNNGRLLIVEPNSLLYGRK